MEMDGFSFYTHFKVVRKDDPRNVFIRRVECHMPAGEFSGHGHALPQYASPST